MILYRYIIKEVLLTMLVVTMVVTAIFMTSLSTRFLNEASQGSISIISVFQILTLQLPIVLSYMLPLGFFFGILLGLGRLYADSEIIAMHSCGVSFAYIYTAVTAIGVVLAIVVFVLMGVLAPKIDIATYRLNQQAKLNINIEKVLPGRFHYLGKQVVLYANSSSIRRGYLKDIFLAIHDLGSSNERNSWKLILANKLSQRKAQMVASPSLIFTEGKLYNVNSESNILVKNAFSKLILNLQQKEKAINLWPTSATLKELWQASSEDKRAKSLLYFRLSVPISVLVLMMYSLPFSKVSPRQGKYYNIFFMLLFYIAYTNLILLMRSWVKGGVLGMMGAMLLTHSLFLVVIIVYYSFSYSCVKKVLLWLNK